MYLSVIPGPRAGTNFEPTFAWPVVLPLVCGVAPDVVPAVPPPDRRPAEPAPGTLPTDPDVVLATPGASEPFALWLSTVLVVVRGNAITATMRTISAMTPAGI